MIISHRYKFIFIKTNKTAGTSVEIALSKFCGPDDIITPISPNDEKLRSHLGYRGPQNYEGPTKKNICKKLNVLPFAVRRRPWFYNHISSKKIKDRIGDQIWNRYYKFCFERNPWDRVISLYYWRYKSEPRPAISEFIESKKILALKRKGIKLYTINGKVVVDKVCKFENITQELESIRTKLGIPEELDLPHAKSRFRKRHLNHREIFNPVQRDKIAEIFSDEINLMGYEF